MQIQDKGAVKIGIMGGTFDPIHYGHLVTAEAARFEFGLERVIFIPAATPPHKQKKTISDSEHRYRMASLAVNSNPFFSVSALEIERGGLSYTVDTLKTLQQIYPLAKLFFITGADAVLELLNWHDVNELFSLCHFIAATRPGYDLEDKLTAWPEEMRQHISTFMVPALAISSTDIRGRVQEHKPIKYLLPEEVEQYIFSNKLYQS